MCGQVVGTLRNGKHGHEAVKDWLPRGVSSRVPWGTRASAITVLQACLSVVFLTWTHEREQKHDLISGQFHKLGNFLIFSVSLHCVLSSLLSTLLCCKDRRFGTVSSSPPIFIHFLLGSLPGFVGRDDGKATWMTLIYFDARRFERSTWQLEACISRIPEDWTLGKCSGEESDTGALQSTSWHDRR